MPWSNNTGGNMQNGNGSNGGPTGGPWGQGPRGPQRPRGPGGGGGNQPPDLEELLRQGQDKLKQVLPGGIGSGGFSPFMGVLVAVGAGLLYLYASAYQVDADELAVETVFGKPKNEISQAGLNFA
ncbi:MAG: protease modulator HflK N-terminal domain-containing protein, partial [Pseudomonadota bacterium]